MGLHQHSYSRGCTTGRSHGKTYRSRFEEVFTDELAYLLMRAAPPRVAREMEGAPPHIVVERLREEMRWNSNSRHVADLERRAYDYAMRQVGASSADLDDFHSNYRRSR